MHSKTLSGLAAVTVGVLAFLGATRSEATHTPVAVAIDVDVSGNAANSLGMTEACNAVGLEVGETLDIDVVVRGVPDGTGHGLGGVGFNLVFDPAVVQVDLIHAFDGPTLIGVGGVSPFVVLDYNFPSGTNSDPPPGVTGDVRSDMAGLGPVAAFGDGIVTRVTLRGVGEGITRLDLYDEMELPWRVGATVYTPDGLEYASTSEGAVIGVGRNGCDGPAPTPRPTPTPLPPPAQLTGSISGPSTVRRGEEITLFFTTGIPLNGEMATSVDYRPSDMQFVACSWELGPCGLSPDQPGYVTFGGYLDLSAGEYHGSVTFVPAQGGDSQATIGLSAYGFSEQWLHPARAVHRLTVSASMTTTPTGGSGGRGGDGPRALPQTGGPTGRDGNADALLGFAALMLAVSASAVMVARRR